MKKIRLLALLLALLMIPFGMLFACDDDPDDSELEDPDDDDDDDDDDDKGGSSSTVVLNKTVNDGTKAGYLAFFSFDNADRGNLGVIEAPTSTSDPNYLAYSDLKPIEPYYTYFRGTLVNGGAYTVKTLSGSNKYLSVQRTGKKMTAPSFIFNVGTALSQDLNATHILEFKLDFSKGLFGETVTLSGVKGVVTQTLFTIEDDVIYDCNGDAIYGEKETDKHDWIDVAIVIDDSKRTYDIYIDMVKQTSSLAYNNASYKSWNQEALTGYRFDIATTNTDDVYVRLDDISIRNGKEKDLGTIVGTDAVVKYYDNASFKYSYLRPTKDGVLNYINSQTQLSGLKTEQFGSGTLISDRITLSKIDKSTGTITDLYHDYGALKGDYNEILTFKSGNAVLKLTTYNNTVYYDADVFDETEGVSGTYTYASGVITFNWGESVAPTVGDDAIMYAKYDASAIKLYSDASCETDIAELALESADENNVLADNEIYAVKLTNITKSGNEGSHSFPFDGTWYSNNKNKLGEFKFSFWATQEMVDNGIIFMLRFVTSDNFYASATYKPDNYNVGLNSYSYTESQLVASGGGFNMANVTEICLTYWGWSNTGWQDGWTMYITELGYEFSSGGIEMEAPTDTKCDHTDEFGDDAFKPYGGMVAGNCAHGSYYLLKCSECGLTKIDTSKPLGYIDAHVYGSETYTKEATCLSNGYTYKLCTVCGGEEIISVIETEGHDMATVSILGKDISQVCKVCGLENTFTVHTELMTFEEKMAQLIFSQTDRNNWSASYENNSEIDISGKQSGTLASWISVVTKSNTGASFKTVETDYGPMLQVKGGATSVETYIDFVPGASSTTPYFKATSFVIEFDMMLGQPGSNGAYPTMQFGMGWRNGSLVNAGWGRMYLQSDGSVQLSEYCATANATNFNGHEKYQLEQGKLYNIALHHDLKNNKVKLYVNGIFWDEAQFVANTADAAIFSLTHYRPWTGGIPTDCEIYFNNFLHYAADKEPVCVLTSGFNVGEDFEGDVKLEDELLNEMKPDISVAENGHQVKFNVPAALYLKQYVLEFGINGQSLKNGTLLVATKNGTGYDRAVDLVTVNEGKLYVMGVLVSETTNVKLSLVFDDNLNSLIVYVDGQRIAGTIYFSGDFADANATIRSFTFKNECGDFEVSGLTMYTGNEVK